MHISIKLKTLIPTSVLAISFALLIATGLQLLSESRDQNTRLLNSYEESEAEDKLGHLVSDLLLNVTTFLLSESHGLQEQNRQRIRENVARLNSSALLLKPIPGTAQEELITLKHYIEDIARTSLQATTLKLPQQQVVARQLLLELSTQQVIPLQQLLKKRHQNALAEIASVNMAAQKDNQNSLIRLGELTLISLCLLLFAYWSNKVHIVAPILKLKQVTDELARGRLDQQVDLKNKDEIGELARDINQLSRSLEKVSTELNGTARIDSLTGLQNRRAFDEHLQQQFDSAIRYEQALTIILFDIDRFKTVNDKHGHDAGDKVLNQAATIAEQQIRDCDVLFRFSGEEFALVLPNTNTDNSLIVAERMRQAFLSKTISFDDQHLKLSASFGVASCPKNGQNIETLLDCAEDALVQAKNSGRNKIIVCNNTNTPDNSPSS